MAESTVILDRPNGAAEIGGCRVRLAAVTDGQVRLAVDAPGAPTGRAGPFVRRYRRPAACGDATEMLVLQIALAYSERVRRITVLNQRRFSAIHARLVDGYTPEIMRAAVRAYAADPWHRQHRAWLDVADFFQPDKLDAWRQRVHDAELAAEKRRNARPMPAGPAKDLVDDLAAQQRPQTEDEQLWARWKALATPEQRRIADQAVDELASLGVDRRRLRPSASCQPVAQQILVILRRGPDAAEGERHGRSDGSA